MSGATDFYGERPAQELLQQIGEHLSGGVVGCHWAEGFPFYYINDRFLRFTGYTYEEFLQRTGGRVLAAIHPDDQAHVTEVINSSLKTQDSYQVEYRLEKKGGGWVWLRGTGKRAIDRGRESIISVSMDITEAVELREALEQKSRELNTLMDGIPCGLCKLRRDEDLTIEYANEYFYELFGYTSQQARDSGFRSGRSVIYPLDWAALREELRAYLAAGYAQFEMEHRYIHHSGSIRWLLARFRLDLQDADFLCAAMLDITDRKEMEERLRLSEEEYRIAVDHTGNVIDTYDVATRTLSQPKAAAESLGVPAVVAELPEAALSLNFVESGSREEYAAFFRAMNEGAPSGAAVVQVRDAQGRRRWLSGRFTMIYSDGGAPLRAILSYSDITEQREKELAYQKWSQYFESLQEGSICYYEYNITQDVYNRSEGQQMEQVPPELGTFTGTAAYMAEHFIRPEDRARYLRFFDRPALLLQYYEGKRELELEHRRLDPEGRYIWALATVQLIQDPYSADIKAFVLIRDIDEEKTRALRLQRLSERDNLTGIYNRRMVVEQINHRLAAGLPTGTHALIMLDLDHFKELNDTYGHHFGDRVLKDLAARMKGQLRSGDFCGRMGGDEFIIFLHNMRSSDDLHPRLEALSKALVLTYEEPARAVTAAMGLAAYPKDGVDFDSLYQAADAALYAAKRAGPGQCAVYKPPPRNE